MKQSGFFTKTRKDSPKDEISKSAQFLIRAGFIYKEMAGVYTMLPLGLKVVKNIENIIRLELNSLGANELQMTALQNPEIWQKTNRWDDSLMDNWFKTKLKNETELGLATTHEEAVTNFMREHINSYKDLPVYVYQFQTKFRNELRAKSGIMRGREFLMKDLYSFSFDQKQHDDFYEKAKQSYFNIFKKVGLGDLTYLTFASGGVFSKYSHEFQTVCDAGEDLIYIDQKTNQAINKEVLIDEVLNDLKLDKNNLIEKKAIEVGNIFTLGTRFSEPLELFVNDEQGQKKTVIMGSYGIGISRLMGVVAEIFADEKGLNWPITISPFEVHLLNLSSKDQFCLEKSKEIYDILKSQNIEVLFDDRNVSAGEKFADSDLIGIPYKIIVGKNSLNLEKDFVLYRQNRDTEEQKISIFDLIQKIKNEKK